MCFTAMVYRIINYLLLVCINSEVILGICPPQPLIEPCVCDNDSFICGGDVKYSVKDIFHRISASIEDDSDKHFENFTLTNTAITRLEENTFHEITFKRVTLKNCTSLRHIQSHTFSRTATTIEEFAQLDASQLGDRRYEGDFSEAISSLVNARKLTFERNNWRTIRPRFFRNIFGVQKQLTEIDFNPNHVLLKQIEKIGHHAFYYLNNLQALNFYGHRISRFNWGSFYFFQPSNHTLEINLSDNNLSANSFHRYSSKQSNRPLSLNLWNNPIEYLSEKVFAPFFSAHQQNKLNVGFDSDRNESSFECDCRSFWIYKRKQELSNQLNDIMCENGNTLWNQTEQQFDDC